MDVGRWDTWLEFYREFDKWGKRLFASLNTSAPPASVSRTLIQHLTYSVASCLT